MTKKEKINSDKIIDKLNTRIAFWSGVLRGAKEDKDTSSVESCQEKIRFLTSVKRLINKELKSEILKLERKILQLRVEVNKKDKEIEDLQNKSLEEKEMMDD